MTTVHIGYLKDSTVGLLNVSADESNGVCEFTFGDIKILYFARPDYEEGRWCSYVGGMTIFRSHTFSNMAQYLNIHMREAMQWCVLIDCWIEYYK